MEIKDIEKLAKLARIELTEKEKETYLKDISSILGYVDQIKNIVAKNTTGSSLRLTSELIAPGTSRNVFRADENPNDSGANTEVLVAEFPKKQGNYLKVKKIL